MCNFAIICSEYRAIAKLPSEKLTVQLQHEYIHQFQLPKCWIPILQNPHLLRERDFRMVRVVECICGHSPLSQAYEDVTVAGVHLHSSLVWSLWSKQGPRSHSCNCLWVLWQNLTLQWVPPELGLAYVFTDRNLLVAIFQLAFLHRIRGS